MFGPRSIILNLLLGSLPYPVIVWTSNFCSTSLVGVYRGCSECNKYDVCLACCRDFRNNKPLNKVAEFGRCGKYKNYWHVRSNTPCSKWRIENDKILCPTCDNCVLELTDTFENDWFSNLEARANSANSKIETNNLTDSKSQQLDESFGERLKAASRESGDDFLYNPLSKDAYEKDESYTKRKEDKEIPLMLKLKDFPSDANYVNVLPRHHDEFIRMLPLREYTDPRKGFFNIAVKLPPDGVIPDLGPKSYIAYGIAKELEKGNSVNAVNILVHTTDVYKGDAEGRGGALWDIFRREDVEKLDAYLLKHYKEFQYLCGCPVDKVYHSIHDQSFYLTLEHKRKLKAEYEFQYLCGCPVDKVYHSIHDQSFYLTLEHKRKLKAEYGVEPWTFEQHLGEAVFIPAGYRDAEDNEDSVNVEDIDSTQEEQNGDDESDKRRGRPKKSGRDNENNNVEAVKFGSLIRMPLHELPGLLGFYVIKNLDTETNELSLTDSSIHVTSQSVHDILGIPIGGSSIDSLTHRKPDDPFIREWKSQFGEKSEIRPNDITDVIVSTQTMLGNCLG
ncbi:hypothetical protein Tco_0644619 [Tanacetum coccineum]